MAEFLSVAGLLLELSSAVPCWSPGGPWRPLKEQGSTPQRKYPCPKEPGQCPLQASVHVGLHSCAAMRRPCAGHVPAMHRPRPSLPGSQRVQRAREHRLKRHAQQQRDAVADESRGVEPHGYGEGRLPPAAGRAKKHFSPVEGTRGRLPVLPTLSACAGGQASCGGRGQGACGAA